MPNICRNVSCTMTRHRLLRLFGVRHQKVGSYTLVLPKRKTTLNLDLRLNLANPIQHDDGAAQQPCFAAQDNFFACVIAELLTDCDSRRKKRQQILHCRSESCTLAWQNASVVLSLVCQATFAMCAQYLLKECVQHQISQVSSRLSSCLLRPI